MKRCTRSRPTQLDQERRHTHNKEGINMDTTMQAGHSMHPSPSRGTYGGVPAGPQPQTKKKTRAVFLCPNTGGTHALPTLHDPERRSHIRQHARARYGENSRKKDPRP